MHYVVHIYLCTEVEVISYISLCKAWVEVMAAFMKGLDANHLLTLGEEGFYSSYKKGLSANPGGLGKALKSC